MSGSTEKTGSELNVFGVGVTILMECGDAAGGHVVARLRCGTGAGAPPHRHPEREAFYVLEGQVTFMVAGQERELGPGAFVQVEPGELHAFGNAGEAEAVLVNMSMPAGHGDFFRAADALFRSGGFTPEAAMAVSRDHGIELEISQDPAGAGKA